LVGIDYDDQNVRVRLLASMDRALRSSRLINPLPRQLSRNQDTEGFAGFWLPEHRDLFEQLKSEILSKPVLARPDPNRRFYVKTDWCCDGMAAALLQADPDDNEALIAESAESLGGPCFFDLQRKGLRR
jgi:hypothetical protein